MRFPNRLSGQGDVRRAAATAAIVPVALALGAGLIRPEVPEWCGPDPALAPA